MQLSTCLFTKPKPHSFSSTAIEFLIPYTKHEKWKLHTLLACFLLTTSDRSQSPLNGSRHSVWHLQDVLSSRQHISLKISTKIIVDFSQRQQSHNVNSTTDKKAAFSSFISTTFQGNLPNKFTSNRPRDISPVHSCTLKSRCQFVDEENTRARIIPVISLKEGRVIIRSVRTVYWDFSCLF